MSNQVSDKKSVSGSSLSAQSASNNCGVANLQIGSPRANGLSNVEDGGDSLTNRTLSTTSILDEKESDLDALRKKLEAMQLQLKLREMALDEREKQLEKTQEPLAEETFQKLMNSNDGITRAKAFFISQVNKEDMRCIITLLTLLVDPESDKYMVSYSPFGLYKTLVSLENSFIQKLSLDILCLMADVMLSNDNVDFKSIVNSDLDLGFYSNKKQILIECRSIIAFICLQVKEVYADYLRRCDSNAISGFVGDVMSKLLIYSMDPDTLEEELSQFSERIS